MPPSTRIRPLAGVGERDVMSGVGAGFGAGERSSETVGAAGSAAPLCGPHGQKIVSGLDNANTMALTPRPFSGNAQVVELVDTHV